MKRIEHGDLTDTHEENTVEHALTPDAILAKPWLFVATIDERAYLFCADLRVAEQNLALMEKVGKDQVASKLSPLTPETAHDFVSHDGSRTFGCQIKGGHGVALFYTGPDAPNVGRSIAAISAMADLLQQKMPAFGEGEIMTVPALVDAPTVGREKGAFAPFAEIGSSRKSIMDFKVA